MQALKDTYKLLFIDDVGRPRTATQAVVARHRDDPLRKHDRKGKAVIEPTAALPLICDAARMDPLCFGVMFAVMTVFAILGMQLYMGGMGHCTNPAITTKALCVEPGDGEAAGRSGAGARCSPRRSSTSAR